MLNPLVCPIPIPFSSFDTLLRFRKSLDSEGVMFLRWMVFILAHKSCNIWNYTLERSRNETNPHTFLFVQNNSMSCEIRNRLVKLRGKVWKFSLEGSLLCCPSVDSKIQQETFTDGMWRIISCMLKNGSRGYIGFLLTQSELLHWNVGAEQRKPSDDEIGS